MENMVNVFENTLQAFSDFCSECGVEFESTACDVNYNAFRHKFTFYVTIWTNVPDCSPQIVQLWKVIKQSEHCSRAYKEGGYCWSGRFIYTGAEYPVVVKIFPH